MNILKSTLNGIVVVTKIGINPSLSEKLENSSSYHMKTIKKQCNKIASWEIVDNDITEDKESFPKIVKVTSISFVEVDADCVSAFAKAQENMLQEVLEAEAVSLKVEKASMMLDHAFDFMLDTRINLPENEEN